ncbi:DUF5134 domain-containing protein [Streptomyces sp. MUM 203J]|uniref:DUF5134 domain-containing protein n=1 Tax=Streptomyces sp. MUM 203J TaxID=2791990 RepID=UPI001F03493A|nr:DUF5134 domain-containing protein [Streptomyces sp. MUM 203J]
MASWLLVALCAATGAYCLVRRARMRRRGAVRERREAASEAVMAFGMATMGVPAAVFAPPEWVWTVYAAVFGTAAARVLWEIRDGRRHLHHLVGCLAMVYMAVPSAGAAAGTHGPHGAHAGGGLPLVTGALLAYYAGWVLWSGTRTVPVGVAIPRGTGTVLDGPELPFGCRMVMATAMLAMLFTL